MSLVHGMTPGVAYMANETTLTGPQLIEWANERERVLRAKGWKPRLARATDIKDQK